MKYWWANQNNSSYASELTGGYLWVPRYRINGTRNPFFESIRIVKIGDIIFSFNESAIRAIGIVIDGAKESVSPEPIAPPRAGEKSAKPNTPGWIVSVAWLELRVPCYPSKHIDVLAPFLSRKLSPIDATTGNGKQGIRIMEVSEKLAVALLELLGGRDPAHTSIPEVPLLQMTFDFYKEG